MCLRTGIRICSFLARAHSTPGALRYGWLGVYFACTAPGGISPGYVLSARWLYPQLFRFESADQLFRSATVTVTDPRVCQPPPRNGCSHHRSRPATAAVCQGSNVRSREATATRILVLYLYYSSYSLCQHFIILRSVDSREFSCCRHFAPLSGAFEIKSWTKSVSVGMHPRTDLLTFHIMMMLHWISKRKMQIAFANNIYRLLSSPSTWLSTSSNELITIIGKVD